jgi:Fe-S oxidoreductase
MARMKIEVQAARAKKRGLSLHDRLVGWLPRYAPIAARVPWLANLRDQLPGAPTLSQVVAGFSARRSLPRWRFDWFRDRRQWFSDDAEGGDSGARDVVLFADTFNRYFEPENIRAAIQVLEAAGYCVHMPQSLTIGRPLCCGRTFLSIGRVDAARREAEFVLEALEPYLARGVPVVGLEPSCILGFRDELPAMIRTENARRLAELAVTFEEFLAGEAADGELTLDLGSMPKRALVHGHCHQKSFGAFDAVGSVLRLVPDLAVETIESSCCGMAGSFGYAADTIDVSLAMGELSLFPAVRKADAEAIIIADGTSCRHQIRDGTGREAMHVARVLAQSLRS